MTKNFSIKIATLIAAALFAVNCGSAQPKDVPNVASGNIIVDQANEQLAKVPVIGFPPFTTTMPMTQFDQYGENAATAAKAVIATMPDGYLLQIVGHANQHRTKSVAYTKSLSVARAKYVYNYFVKKGVDKSKLTYTGVGNDEPDANLSHDNNRRVTFKLVQK